MGLLLGYFGGKKFSQISISDKKLSSKYDNRIYYHVVATGVLICDILLFYAHSWSFTVYQTKPILQSSLVIVTSIYFSDGERKAEVKKDKDIKSTVIVCGLVILFVSIVSMLCVAYWKKKKLSGIT